MKKFSFIIGLMLIFLVGFVSAIDVNDTNIPTPISTVGGGINFDGMKLVANYNFTLKQVHHSGAASATRILIYDGSNNLLLNVSYATDIFPNLVFNASNVIKIVDTAVSGTDTYTAVGGSSYPHAGTAVNWIAACSGSSSLTCNDLVYTRQIDYIITEQIFPPSNISNISFLSQSPSNITDMSIFSSNINITYNYSVVNVTNISLSVSTSSSILSCIQWNNGVCVLQNNTYINYPQTSNSTSGNFSSISWTLTENDVYPWVQNALLSNFSHQHDNLTKLTANNDFASIQLINMSTLTSNNILEVMAVSTGDSKVYACNSSYNFGSLVINSRDCQVIGNIIGTSYNHSHGGFIQHNLVPYSVSSGRIGGSGIVVTPTMYFLIKGTTGFNMTWGSVNNVFLGTRGNTSKTTANGGNTWIDLVNGTGFEQVFDAHVHQYSGTTFINYNASGNFSGNFNVSALRSDLIDLVPLNPQPPIITFPFDSSQSTRYMNITWLNATSNIPGSNISYYNISLLNDDLTFNQTIIASTTGNSYLWDVYSSTLALKSYFVRVDAYDFVSPYHNFDEENFTLLTNAILNITAFDVQAASTVANWTGNVTDIITGVSTLTTISGTVLQYDIIKGHNYTIFIDALGYAFSQANYTANNSNFQTVNVPLYLSNSININIIDEITNNTITDNITVTFKSLTDLFAYSTSNGSLIVSNITSSDYTLIFTGTNYATRNYYATIIDRGAIALTARLLNNSNAIAIGIFTKTQTAAVLPNVLITIQKQYFGGSYATVAQFLSDINGFATVNLQSGTDYKVILSVSGYKTKAFNQQFYLANSPYTFQLTSTAESLYTDLLNGVSYFYSPTNTTLRNGTYTFQISTFNASFNILWTAVNTNGIIVNVSGSPGGATASNIVDLSSFSGTYPVIYSFSAYNQNSSQYIVFTLPINYFIENRQPNNITLTDSMNTFKNDVGSAGWTAIIAVFSVLAAVATIVQISGNLTAGISVGVGMMILFAFMGWISAGLVSAIAVITILTLYLQRQGGF